MLMSRTFTSIFKAVQAPWRTLVATVCGHRIVITLEPQRVRVAWVSEPVLGSVHRFLRTDPPRKIMAQFEENWGVNVPSTVSSSSEPLLDSDSLGRVLSQIPTAWRAAPCHVVVSSAWVQWGDLPWLGSSLTPGERMALSRKRLAALYGAPYDRRIVTNVARFGHTQLIAGMSPTLLGEVQRVFSAANLRVTAISPVHTIAWNAFAAQVKSKELQRSQDMLFASVEDGTLTLSWLRHVDHPSGEVRVDAARVLRGIRNIPLEPLNTQTDVIHGSTRKDAAESIFCDSTERQIRRECVLQRLVKPVVYVLSRGLKTPLDSSAAKQPSDWHYCAVEDWYEGPRDAIDHGTNGTKHAIPVHAGSANPRQSVLYRIGRLFAQETWLEPIDLNFAGSSTLVGSTRWQRWLLVTVVACACAVGAVYVQWSAMLTDSQDVLEQSSKDQKSSQATVHAPELSATQREQHTQWQRVQSGLRRPWGRLFQCIEACVGSDVTLMQIQPDTQTGELHLTGDARAYKAIGKLVQTLQDSAATPACVGVRSPYLSSYQVNEQDPLRTVHFEINAKWGADRQLQDASDRVTSSARVSDGSVNP